MEEDNKIIRSINYKAFVEDNPADISDTYDSVNAILNDNRESESLVRDVRASDYVSEGTIDHSIISIEDYKEEQIRKKEEARLKAIEEIEKQKVIEEPIDLSDTEEEYYETFGEKRVSYKRTFGVTKSRQRDINKYTVIGLLTLLGICVIIRVIFTFIW